MINLLTSTKLSAQLFRNFVLGGTIIASVSYLATFTSPVIASIWWSYPISILPSIYFMKANKKPNIYIAKFLLSTTFALVLLLMCTFLLSHYIKNNSASSLTMPIVKSSGWWLIGSVIFYLFVTKSGYSKYFI